MRKHPMMSIAGTSLENNMEVEIWNILNKYGRNVTNQLSSYEIYNLLPLWLQNQLQNVCLKYKTGYTKKIPAAEPAVYVGVKTALMSKGSRVVYSCKICPILNKKMPAFYV